MNLKQKRLMDVVMRLRVQPRGCEHRHNDENRGPVKGYREAVKGQASGAHSPHLGVRKRGSRKVAAALRLGDFCRAHIDPALGPEEEFLNPLAAAMNACSDRKAVQAKCRCVPNLLRFRTARKQDRRRESLFPEFSKSKNRGVWAAGPAAWFAPA